MPGVFSALNTRLQGSLIGKELRELSPELPAGIVESQEGFVKSQVIPNTKVFIKGKYDLLIRQPDNTYLIVDFKISQPSEDKTTKFQTQLQAYHYAFEHPVHGEPISITRMGLIIMYPDTTKFENGRAILDFPPQWLEIPIDEQKFLRFMGEVSLLLEGPTPMENPRCPWCQYRHLGEKLAHPQTSDIPF